MIVKYIEPLTPYEKYFTEAPKQKKKSKIVVTVNPKDKRRKPLAEVNDDPEDIPEEDLELSDDEFPDPDEMDEMEDISDEELAEIDDEELDEFPDPDVMDDEGEEEPAEEPSDTPPEPVNQETQPPATDPPVQAEADTGEENTGGDEPEENPQDNEGGEGGPEEPADGPPADDNVDDEFPDPDAMDDSEGGGDEAADAPADDTGGDDGTKGVSNTHENQLKFTLYRSFRDLYNAIDVYITKINEKTGSSTNFNLVLKTANNKLTDLAEVIFEYMVIKFKEASYMEALKFYNECLVSVNLVFELIDINKDKPEVNGKNNKLNS